MNQIYKSDIISFQDRMAPATDDEVKIERTEDEILPEPYVIKENGKVAFQLFYPNATNVMIRDYFHTYSMSKQGEFWCGEYDFGDGFISVFLNIDGSDVISKYLPIGYGGNQLINFIEIPEKDFSFVSQNCPHGSVVHDYVESKVTGETERVLIYLPPDYMENIERRYPVLYLQHGHGENEGCWVNQGKMNYIFDNLIAEHKAEPAIVVMANGMRYEEVDGHRILRYQKYEEFLMKELMSYMDHKYRTIANKEHRAMAGLSMGSLQTSNITFNHSEYFSYVGVFSGFVQDIFTGDQDHLVEEKIDRFKSNVSLFYRAIGSDDQYKPFFEADDEFLQKKRIDCVRKIYQGGQHEWKVWRHCFYDFMQMIFTK